MALIATVVSVWHRPLPTSEDLGEPEDGDKFQTLRDEQRLPIAREEREECHIRA
jgi:hypothetical protein